MQKHQKIVIGVVTGAATLYLLKLYFAGGKCTITKDLSRNTAVVTGGNTGIGK